MFLSKGFPNVMTVDDASLSYAEHGWLYALFTNKAQGPIVDDQTLITKYLAIENC